MARNDKKIHVYQSPVCLFIIVAFAITITEALIMVSFRFLPPFSTLFIEIYDSLLLFVIISPIIYLFVFRPLKLHISKREETEKVLNLANEQLQRNITNLKQTDEKLRYLNTIQISIRKINEILLTCKEESHLFSKICDSILHVGFIKFVWIGVIEKGSSEVKLVAQKGFEDVFISSINIDLKDVSSHLDPIGKAIHTGEPVDLLDIERDSIKEPWKDEAMKREYASSVAIPVKDSGEVVGVLSVCSDKKYAFGKEEMEYLMEMANDIAVGVKSLWLEKDLKRSVGNLQRTLNATIEAISLMSEMRDPYTTGHERRVAQLACAIAKEIGMTEYQVEGIRVCAFLHDVGKIVVPAEILSKPSQLNEYEYGIVKSHPRVGYDILKRLEFPYPVAQTILQHHEMLNGAGYPSGLKGEEIVLEARILAVADVVEAMTNHRPYRPALGIDKALDEISRNKDVLYDAKAVDACMRLFMEKGFRFEA